MNLGKAIDEGLKFYISENNVVLCPGDEKGFIPSKYFKYIRERVWKGDHDCPGKVLWKPPILVHALNGNPPARTGKGKKVKAFANSSFELSDKDTFSRALSKLCGHEITWVTKKNGDRFDGQATGKERFNAFWWRVKRRASFSGRGAGAAKRWVLQELEKGQQHKEPYKQGTQDSGLPSEQEEGEKRLVYNKNSSPNARKAEDRWSPKGAKKKKKNWQKKK